LKSENFELRNKNIELKREIAKFQLKDKLNSGVPVVYADTDSLKVMKEGDEKFNLLTMKKEGDEK